MAEKVARCKVKKEPGYLYYVDKKGNVARSPMARPGKKVKGKAEVVAACAIKKEPDYMYFIDKDGDIARAKMARGKKCAKKPQAKKAKKK